MIVLGRKYKFTDLEKKRLSKRFASQTIIKYSSKDPLEVLEEIKSLIAQKDVDLIVLNTKYSVPNELISFLTNSHFNRTKKSKL